MTENAYPPEASYHTNNAPAEEHSGDRPLEEDNGQIDIMSDAPYMADPSSRSAFDVFDDGDVLRCSTHLTEEEFLRRKRDYLARLRSLQHEQALILRSLLKTRYANFLIETKSESARGELTRARSANLRNKRRKFRGIPLDTMGIGQASSVKCAFSGFDGTSPCSAYVMPLSKYCFDHILHDPLQHLFQRCQYTDPDPSNPVPCTWPVLFQSKLPFCHHHKNTLPPEEVHAYITSRKPIEAALDKIVVDPSKRYHAPTLTLAPLPPPPPPPPPPPSLVHPFTTATIPSTSAPSHPHPEPSSATTTMIVSAPKATPPTPMEIVIPPAPMSFANGFYVAPLTKTTPRKRKSRTATSPTARTPRNNRHAYSSSSAGQMSRPSVGVSSGVVFTSQTYVNGNATTGAVRTPVVPMPQGAVYHKMSSNNINVGAARAPTSVLQDGIQHPTMNTNSVGVPRTPNGLPAGGGMPYVMNSSFSVGGMQHMTSSNMGPMMNANANPGAGSPRTVLVGGGGGMQHTMLNPSANIGVARSSITLSPGSGMRHTMSLSSGVAWSPGVGRGSMLQPTYSSLGKPGAEAAGVPPSGHTSSELQQQQQQLIPPLTPPTGPTAPSDKPPLRKMTDYLPLSPAGTDGGTSIPSPRSARKGPPPDSSLLKLRSTPVPILPAPHQQQFSPSGGGGGGGGGGGNPAARWNASPLTSPDGLGTTEMEMVVSRATPVSSYRQYNTDANQATFSLSSQVNSQVNSPSSYSRPHLLADTERTPTQQVSSPSSSLASVRPPMLPPSGNNNTISPRMAQQQLNSSRSRAFGATAAKSPLTTSSSKSNLTTPYTRSLYLAPLSSPEVLRPSNNLSGSSYYRTSASAKSAEPLRRPVLQPGVRSSASSAPDMRPSASVHPTNLARWTSAPAPEVSKAYVVSPPMPITPPISLLRTTTESLVTTCVVPISYQDTSKLKAKLETDDTIRSSDACSSDARSSDARSSDTRRTVSPLNSSPSTGNNVEALPPDFKCADQEVTTPISSTGFISSLIHSFPPPARSASLFDDASNSMMMFSSDDGISNSLLLLENKQEHNNIKKSDETVGFSSLSSSTTKSAERVLGLPNNRFSTQGELSPTDLDCQPVDQPCPDEVFSEDDELVSVVVDDGANSGSPLIGGSQPYS